MTVTTTEHSHRLYKKDKPDNYTVYTVCNINKMLMLRGEHFIILRSAVGAST